MGSFVAGCAAYFAFLLLAFLFDGGHLQALLHPTALVVVPLAPWIVLCGTHGPRGAFGHLARALRGEGTPETDRFLSLWLSLIYGTAAVLCLLDLVVMTAFLAGELWKIGEKTVAAGACLLVGTALAEGVVRPLRHRAKRP